MQKRKAVGRGLFYSRDSGGRHENTPGQYIDWARRQAKSLGVTFSGTGEQIERMTRNGMAVEGDIYWDYGVSGEKLLRKGLDGFLKEALADSEVSHVFIPRRDRFARPEDPFDAVKLENTLRHAGITVVFMDKTCPPILRGQKRDIGEMIVSVLDYNYSGEYVRGRCIVRPRPQAFVTNVVCTNRVMVCRALTIGSMGRRLRASSSTQRASACQNPESKTEYASSS